MFRVLQIFKEVGYHSGNAQALPSTAKDRSHLLPLCPLHISLFTTLLMSAEHWVTFWAMAPAGCAARNALPLHLHVTGSLAPFRVFLVCHPPTQPFLVTLYSNSQFFGAPPSL